MRVIPKDKVIFHFNPTNPANYTAESDRCDHHALRRKVDRHNFHAKGIAGVRTADRDRAYGAGRDGHIGRTRRAG